MKRLILSLVLIGLLGLGLAACGGGGGGGGSSTNLVGVWTVTDSTDPADIGDTIVFNADGTSLWSGFPILWSYSDGALALTFIDETTVANVTWLSSDKVQISDPANGVVIIMVRN